MSQRLHDRRRGATLVEVMTALALLAITALTAGAYIFQARAALQNQRHKRVALTLLSSRLEALRAAPFLAIQPPALTYETYYLARTSNGWSVTATDPAEVVVQNKRTFRLTTTVRFADIDGAEPTYDLVRLRVSTRYRADIPDEIVLESACSPW